MAYVDGFLLAVRKDQMSTYKRMAKDFKAFCKEMGALDYCEAAAEDVKVGKLTSFPRAVKLKANETVVFSWVVYPSKAVRNKANKLMVKDPRFEKYMDAKNLPFDGKRMIYGGFKPFITL